MSMFGLPLSRAKKRLLGEGAWVAFGSVARTAALLVGTRALTEFVRPEVYGTVSLLVGVLGVGLHVFVASITQAAIRFYADAARDDTVATLRRTVRAMLVRRIVLLVALALAGGSAASYVWGVPYAAVLALIGLLAVTALVSFEQSLLTAARRQRAFSVWTSFESWAKPALAVLLVLWLGGSPQAVLLGYMLAVGAIYLGFRLSPLDRVGASPAGEVDGGLRRQIMRYAVPLMPLAVVGWTVNLSDRYIIAGLLDTAQVGLYAASYGLVSMPFITIQGVFSTTLRPVYYGAVAGGDRRLERRVFRLWLFGTAGICAFGAVAVFFLRDWIAALFLAERYRSGADLMPWIALGHVLMVVGLVFAQRFHAYKRTRALLLVRSVVAVVSLLVAVPMIARLELLGAAVSCPVYFLVMAVMMYTLSRRGVVQAPLVGHGDRTAGDSMLGIRAAEADDCAAAAAQVEVDDGVAGRSTQ